MIKNPQNIDSKKIQLKNTVYFDELEKDEKETENRLKILAGDALGRDANLRDALAELWPDRAVAFRKNASEARKVEKNQTTFGRFGDRP